MFTVMLVDDEPIILDKLRHIIHWKEHDCVIVAEAESGIQALEVCNKLKPEIIFSDIYMPLLDGIEFSEKLREILPESLVVLISGYNEFSYAQKAIEAGVFRYILKPLQARELINILSEAKQHLTARRQEAEEKKRLQRMIKENLPSLREKFFADLIEGELNCRDLREQLAFLELAPAGGLFGVIAVHLDNYHQLAGDLPEAELQLFKHQIINMLHTYLPKVTSFLYAFINKPREIIVVYGLEQKKNEEAIYETLFQVQDRFRKVSNVTFSAGLGRPYPDLGSLKNSYREANLALDFKVWAGKNALIPYNDLENTRSGRLLYFQEYENFTSTLRKGDREQAESYIAQLTAALKADDSIHLTKSLLHLTILDLVNQIIRSLLEFNCAMEEVFGADFNPLREINNYETIDDLECWVKSLTSQAIDFIILHKQEVGKNFVEKAREYLENNFPDPELNLNKVAKEVYVSACYLSHLFKEVTGQTITEYLHKVRIRQAKKLLQETPLKIYEVAAEVGFKDSHYFGIVFKKSTGLTPGEYRDKIQIDNFI